MESTYKRLKMARAGIGGSSQKVSFQLICSPKCPVTHAINRLYSRLYSRGQATCQGGNEDEQVCTSALAREWMGLTMAQKMT